jgi:uncharacterized cofD-like protein
MADEKVKRVVVIGGGTGSFTVLSGLKSYPIQITAIITTLDSGGSTGRLRDQLGVLPPGDLRQALVALSDSEKIWRDLFTYRFDSGDLEGHNFGNIFISALEKITGSFESAIDLASYILDTNGNVVPVTVAKSELCAVLENGEIIRGESTIDDSDNLKARISHLYLDPPAFPNPKALRAIKQADLVVFCPGDLYTSIIPNLLVSDIARVVKTSRAKKVYIPNLVTKRGHTEGFGVKEHVELLESYLDTAIDIVVINNAPIPEEIATYYKSQDSAEAVLDNLNGEDKYRLIRGDFIDDARFEQHSADIVKRSVLRHSPKKLSQALYGLIEELSLKS